MTLPYQRILGILTILLAGTLAAVSAAGVFLSGTYERESASIAAQVIGQDMVDLFLVVPLLLISFRMARRGSRTWILIYGGVLAYLMYSFVIYAFGLRFNRFFLLYCATLGLSLYAFVVWMKGAARMEWNRWFGNLPVRGTAVFLFLVAAIFYGLWLSATLPPAIKGSVPDDIRENGFMINPVHVIDMAFALPALITAGVLLWKRKSLGYLLAAVSLVFIVLLTVALAAMMAVLQIRGIGEDPTVIAVFAVICLVSVALLVPVFRTLTRSNPNL